MQPYHRILITNYCCFKSLSFSMTCYTAMGIIKPSGDFPFWLPHSIPNASHSFQSHLPFVSQMFSQLSSFSLAGGASSILISNPHSVSKCQQSCATDPSGSLLCFGQFILSILNLSTHSFNYSFLHR